MKMKIMNVCSVALLAIGIWACSGQKKGTANVEVATDSVEVTADAKSVQADSTGYIVRVGEMAPDFTITLTDGATIKCILHFMSIANIFIKINYAINFICCTNPFQRPHSVPMALLNLVKRTVTVISLLVLWPGILWKKSL